MAVNFILSRAEQYLAAIKDTIEQACVPIDDILYQEGRDTTGSWQTFVKDSYWGKNDTWYQFRTEFTIPAAYEGKCVRGKLVTGREGGWNALNPQFLLRINGHVIQALDTNHQTFLLSASAKEGETYKLEFEAYAGRELGNTVTFRDVPAQFRLYAFCHSEDAENAYYDLYAAKTAAEIYPETDYRRIQIENYLTRALNLIDCRVLSSEAYFASLRAASGYMREEFYGKFCGQENIIADCVGHTHIDVAWLWCLEQTRAKAVRSFSTEIALMEEYPEHKFGSSQPQLYQFVKEECPEIYERIKEKVKEGRWEVEGAMWLEADCNLSSGESLIRQILHGKRFMKEEFGVDSKVLWLPDVFGYSAALPQILKKTGVETFVTSKIHWSESNHFPYDTFLWKGIDGTEVFTQFITGGDVEAKLQDGSMFSTYNAQILPIALAKGWEIYQQKDINNEILVSFGHGDGGGGVTREMLEMQRRTQYGIPGTPRTRLTTIADTLERIRKNVEGKKLPTWFGELYLELHRGTYTSMARNKRYNRYAEFLLQEVEVASVTDKVLLQGSYPKKALYQDWSTVLLNQFHDIIPGSSIFEVYEESERQYQELLKTNGVRLENSLYHLAGQAKEAGIFVYNPTGVNRDGIIEADGQKYYAKDVPAFGWKMITESETAGGDLLVSTSHMENDFFLIDLDETGALTGIYDRRNDREVLSGRANVLEAYDDHPRDWDNWELSNYYRESMWEIDEVSEITTEEDAVSATVSIRRPFLRSSITQKITIYRDMPRIDFDIEMDWHENHIFVKTAFPVDILSDRATYEIQYGATERPAHRNTTWDAAKFEVCAQKWVDFSEYGYGVALLNDCKYGHDIHDGVMRLSLVKCGTFPNHKADQGYHHAKYSLMPHAGSWQEAGVTNEAYAFNCPLKAVRTEGGGSLALRYSLVNADAANVIVTVVKEACDGEDIIIRAYEANGKRTKAVFTLGFEAGEISEVDMLETEEIEKLMSDGNTFHTTFRPYEIKTFRIKS
ncbi:MAG: alpha-mannosidase [Lachnospiraceae bacterium]|nr:alpha-mannosidase [Lachnospiraceae bacterium]